MSKKDSDDDSSSTELMGSDFTELFTNKAYVEHVQQLPSGRIIKYMELEACSTDANLTGQILWPGCSLLLHWLDLNLDFFNGKYAVELGAGTGICSLFIAEYAHPQYVFTTDGNDVVTELMNQNLSKYPELSNISAGYLEWSRENAAKLIQETKSQTGTQKYDIVFGSEIAYNTTVVNCLSETIDEFLKPDGRFIVGHIFRYQNATDAFMNAMKQTGFIIEKEIPWDSIMNYRMELIEGSIFIFKRSK